jgi:hypothetical protein
MDPLSKIATNTFETTKRLDKVIELLGANGASSAGKAKEGKKDKPGKSGLATLGVLSASAGTLVEALVKLKGAQKSVDIFINLIKGTGEALAEFKNPEESLKAAETVDMIGKSVLRYAINLALAAPLLILAMPGVALLGLSIRLLVASAGEAANELEKFQAIFAIGRGVLGYAAGMALVAILAPLVLIGAAVFGLSIRLLVKAAGTGAANVEAMNAVNTLGKGALIFAGTMALVAFIAPLVLVGAAAFSLSVLMVGLALKVLGKDSKKAGKGLIWMGLGVLAFSASLALSAMILQGDINDYLKVGLLLGGTAFVFYFIGRGYKQIGYGALVVAAMGLGLLIFNFGYIPFMETAQKVTLEDAGRQAAILTGIATVFGLAGFAAGFILAGAGAFAAAGISLVVLTYGLTKFKALKWKEEDSLGLTTVLTGIKLAFLGSDEKEEGLYAKLGGVVTGALDAVRMTEAAFAFTAAGLSLIFLSKGLSRFKALKWTETDSITLTTTLGGITAAFASAGGNPSNPGGVFGLVFGTTFEPNAVERGIDSVMDAGNALTGIAKGLMSFQNLINNGVVFGTPDSNGNYAIGTLGYAVSHTLGFIRTAFAAVGNEGDVDDNGFFGAIGFKENIVAKGINAVKGAGKELTQIVTGLTSFQALVEKDINWDVLGDTIKKALTFVGDAFSAIGGKETEDTGLFGIKWDENSVEKGIDAVSGAGKELTQIATGLTNFQALVAKNIDWTALGNAIKKSLTFVGDAFSAIGGKEVKDSAFFGLIKWDENTVQKGIKAVKGTGAVLTEIATGLTKFSELKDSAGLAKNISTLLTSIGTTFSTVYSKNPKLSVQLKDFGNFINILGKRAKDKTLEKAAKDMAAMSKAINSVDIKKAQSFSDLFKYGAQLASNKNSDEAIKALVKAVEDIKKLLSEQNATTTTATNTTSAFPSFANNFMPTATTPAAAKPAAETNQVMQQLQMTLASINTTLQNLPGAISQIELKKSEA